MSLLRGREVDSDIWSDFTRAHQTVVPTCKFKVVDYCLIRWFTTATACSPDFSLIQVTTNALLLFTTTRLGWTALLLQHHPIIQHHPYTNRFLKLHWLHAILDTAQPRNDLESRLHRPCLPCSLPRRRWLGRPRKHWRWVVDCILPPNGRWGRIQPIGRCRPCYGVAGSRCSTEAPGVDIELYGAYCNLMSARSRYDCQNALS